MKLFKKILVANRGEIACRVIRSARQLGIRTVAVYSAADADSLHVSMADEAYSLGNNELSETYLDIGKIIKTAGAAGADAIHPGYGFLAENPEFVRACDQAGVVFIGPDERAIKLMGNKIESREFVRKIGIPMTEGLTGDIPTLRKKATTIPFPILVKAAAGGGGKGMRIVYKEEELDETLESTSREAKSYFGDGTIFIEKFIEEPRHIEIQVLGDHHGNVIHLFERECSIQRRYQKIIEESPSPTLTPEVRKEMGEAAVRIAREIGYRNAGTVEFLVDKDLNFYFLEMNTRVQVEHPVTEMVTGVDIVREQILIATGRPLSVSQEEVSQHGHAIECRIYAEDPEMEFLPSPGDMTLYHEPAGPGIRIDTGIERASTIESFYDPMISKLVVWGESRDIARERSLQALEHYVVHGIKTNITYLRQIMQEDAFILNQISTNYCDEHTGALVKEIHKARKDNLSYLPAFAYLLYDFHKWKVEERPENPGIWRYISFWRDIMEMRVVMEEEDLTFEILRIAGDRYHCSIGGREILAERRSIAAHYIEMAVDGQQHSFYISTDNKGKGYVSQGGFVYNISRPDVLPAHEEILGSFDEAGGGAIGNIISPMPGKVIKIGVSEGDTVEKGQSLLIVEAMKMENHITAPFNGKVEKINIKTGDMVDGNKNLIILTKQD